MGKWMQYFGLEQEPPQEQQNFSAGDTGYYAMSSFFDPSLMPDSTSREAALQVPAVLRGRNLICNISTLPLRLLDTKRKPVRNALFEQLDPEVPNVVTLAMLIEDLLFDGIGWFEVLERDEFNFPRAVRHVDSRRVSVKAPAGHNNPLPSGFDPASTIWVDGKPVNGRNYIRFDSPNPPLLLAARRAIRRAVLLEDAASMYAETPAPYDYFSPAEGASGLTKTKIEGVLSGWQTARKKRKTAFVPETLAYNTVQSPNPADLQLVQLQQRAALEIANAIGIDPEDLGISTTSRTYQNDTSRNQAKINEVLSGYMRAITDRLNMADVTRSGYRASFDLDDYLRADPATRWQINQTALAMGATDIKEIREREEWVERDDLNAPQETPQGPAERPVIDQEASALHRTFSSPSEGTQTFAFDSDEVTFAANTESRTVEGTVLLFGATADNGMGKFVFQPGSIEWKKSAVSRVKLLRDHDWKSLLGAATKVTDDGKTLSAAFKVAKGAAGDQALADAESGGLDGFSVGVDITDYKEGANGEYIVTRAVLNEISLTPRPAFEDARLTRVTASKTDETKENSVTDATPQAETGLDEKIAAAVAAALAKNDNAGDKAANLSAGEGEKAEPINPVRPTAAASFEVAEASPYRFDRAGRFIAGENEFSTDLGQMLKARDNDGTKTEFGKRVMAQISAGFDVDRADVATIQPAVNRPDMYYEAPTTRTPVWNLINKGGLPNGADPFIVPKFASASGLVADHTEGTEPASGAFTTTSQTITPTPLSGKVSITRETLERGGNPAASNLIWGRMLREYDLAKETASASFLAGLAGLTNTTFTAGGASLPAELKSLLVSLNFTPSYDWTGFALEKVLYEALANLEDSEGRPLYPAIGASNADGTTGNLFQTINLNGVRGVPAGSLASTAGAANKSYLFDPSVVAGHASAPQRLDFAGTDPEGAYSPVAYVDIALFGWKAFYNIDAAGVRTVTYDSVA